MSLTVCVKKKKEKAWTAAMSGEGKLYERIKKHHKVVIMNLHIFDILSKYRYIHTIPMCALSMCNLKVIRYYTV